jgi:hypothetical protein
MSNTIFKHLFLFSCRGNLFPHHQNRTIVPMVSSTSPLMHQTTTYSLVFTYLFRVFSPLNETSVLFFFPTRIETVNSCYSCARNLRTINSSCVSFWSLCSHLCPAMILLIIQNIQTLKFKITDFFLRILNIWRRYITTGSLTP